MHCSAPFARTLVARLGWNIAFHVYPFATIAAFILESVIYLQNPFFTVIRPIEKHAKKQKTQQHVYIIATPINPIIHFEDLKYLKENSFLKAMNIPK
jgi:hypothetical protein